MSSPEAQWVDLGEIDYLEAWRLQRGLVAARRDGLLGDLVLICSHPHVYTLGVGGDESHMLADDERLSALGARFVQSDRGGDITYHGPGQVVGYPIVDLKPRGRDVVRFVRQLEEVLVRVAGEYGLEARPAKGLTGVWVGREKLAAIGLRLRRWISMHGFALNVTTDLSYFREIVPCGLQGSGVTSLTRLLERPVECDEVKPRLIQHIEEVLGLRLSPGDRGELERLASAAPGPRGPSMVETRSAAPRNAGRHLRRRPHEIEEAAGQGSLRPPAGPERADASSGPVREEESP